MRLAPSRTGPYVEDRGLKIVVSRLNEMDWEDHLQRKRWYMAPGAIEFARVLYGVEGTSSMPPAEDTSSRLAGGESVKQ